MDPSGAFEVGTQPSDRPRAVLLHEGFWASADLVVSHFAFARRWLFWVPFLCCLVWAAGAVYPGSCFLAGCAPLSPLVQHRGKSVKNGSTGACSKSVDAGTPSAYVIYKAACPLRGCRYI